MRISRLGDTALVSARVTPNTPSSVNRGMAARRGSPTNCLRVSESRGATTGGGGGSAGSCSVVTRNLSTWWAFARDREAADRILGRGRYWSSARILDERQVAYLVRAWELRIRFRRCVRRRVSWYLPGIAR